MLTRFRRRGPKVIALSADIITLAPVVATLVIVGAGYLANAPVVGLWIALAVSLVANAALAVQLVSRLATEREARRKANAFAARLTPKPNRWIGQPGNLATLSLTNADLEAAYEASVAIALERLGPDAEVRFFSLGLTQYYDSFEREPPEIGFDAYGGHMPIHAGHFRGSGCQYMRVG